MSRSVLPAFLVLLATACVGQVGSSSSTEHSDPATLDECKLGALESCTQDGGNVGSRGCEAGQYGTVWGACGPAKCSGQEIACTTADSQPGVAQCVNGLSASACGLAGECTPGAAQSYGTYGCEQVCSLGISGWQWQDMPCDTPLVLAFDGDAVDFTRASGAFDLAGRDASIATRWVSARTPWLALDIDGNGRIDDGRELFGSMTALPDGRRASNGFVALAALDDDHDDEITSCDAAFDRLVLWRDADQDRRSSAGEMVSARDAGLVAIRLSYGVSPRCSDGDCEVERATFVFRDAAGREREGAVIDVHLATR
jgi:hypothetical protein